MRLIRAAGRRECARHARLLVAVAALVGIPTHAWQQAPQLPYATGKLQLHFIDVGEGDATLLVSPGGETVLFDNGVFHQCDKPISYLQQLGVTRIDYEIVSHYHAGHIGCTAELHSDVPLTHVLYDHGPGYHGDFYNSYVNAMGSRRETATDRTTITLDQKSASPVTIRIVALNGNGIDAPAEADRSVVSLIAFGQFKAVIGGDLSGVAADGHVDVESSVAKKVGQVDVYKIHDHGSRYSSNTAWLEAVRPRLGILSVGSDNRDGHPTEACLERLHRAGVKTYWTEAGNGVEPELGVDVVGGNILVEVAPSATIFTVRTSAQWPTVDEFPLWATGIAPPMTGLSRARMPVTFPTVTYSWSKRSGVYHYSTCSFVKSIRPEDLETSLMPAVGKTLHKGCPK